MEVSVPLVSQCSALPLFPKWNVRAYCAGPCSGRRLRYIDTLKLCSLDCCKWRNRFQEAT